MMVETEIRCVVHRGEKFLHAGGVAAFLEQVAEDAKQSSIKSNDAPPEVLAFNRGFVVRLLGRLAEQIRSMTG